MPLEDDKFCEANLNWVEHLNWKIIKSIFARQIPFDSSLIVFILFEISFLLTRRWGWRQTRNGNFYSKESGIIDKVEPEEDEKEDVFMAFPSYNRLFSHHTSIESKESLEIVYFHKVSLLRWKTTMLFLIFKH